LSGGQTLTFLKVFMVTSCFCDKIVTRDEWKSSGIPCMMFCVKILKICFFACGCAVAMGLGGCGEAPREKADVIVLQTGRLRGNVYPQSLQANAPLQHYPFLAGYVKKVREEAARDDARVVLVDLGDSLGGSFASHVTGSRNMNTFFNELGYDVVALSNLDFHVSPELVEALDAEVINPFVDESGNPATQGTLASAVLDKNGLPVEVFANFYGDTPRADYPERFPARFGSVEVGEVLPLREYPQSDGDGLRLLTWMKFESPENPPAEFLEAMRRAGVDAILAHRIYGGHKLEAWAEGGIITWDPPVSLNILRNNGGFALARLDLKKDGDSWRVLNQELVPMTANTADADQEMIAAIDAYADEIRDADKVVGELREAMSEEDILAVYMDVLASVPGADAVVYSLQSIRTDWPPGPLSASGVFNALPWTTPVVEVALDRTQLARAVEKLGLTVWTRDNAPEEGPLRVVTSEFFASLIRQQLELEADSIAPTGIPSEFDFFVQALLRNPAWASGAPFPAATISAP
jgi:hypothetical protein